MSPSSDLPSEVEAQAAEIAELQRELEHWRTKAIMGWAAGLDSPAEGTDRPTRATSEIVAQRESVSWRVNLSWRVSVPMGVARRAKSVVDRVRHTVTGR